MHYDVTPPVLREPLVRALLIMLVAISALLLTQMVWTVVIQFGDLILLFVFAWVISFLLEPVVGGLQRWLPRAAAVLLVYSTLLIALTSSVVLLVPVLVSQTQTAAERLPELDNLFRRFADSVADGLATRGVTLADYTGQLVSPLAAIGPWIVANAVTLATATATILTQVLLTLILSLYFMFDGARLGQKFVAAFPSKRRDEVAYFVVSVNRAFTAFLRGQIIQAGVYGLGIAFIMIGAGLPFAALASVLGGISIFIPFLGPVLGTVVPIVIALIADAGKAWLVALLTIGLNTIVINVVAPKVMSREIGLSPVLVLAAVIIGARVGGPWGALFGIPIAAVISTMISFYQLNVADREQQVVEMTRVEAEPPDDTDSAEESSAVRAIT
ncbi:MAG: hypothetical protein A3F84_01645 [Candidatus Handelsmanbacteria bacterium RIFCSPLOWO2_12_FULL_64_10]|uniref:AI-2E family transporter n=1 Tax=Handelsmanbacteria sp. (strain RIFCSPLOWO2_12_FULL_64_10) TaxID=1817868 RepID=A0A1F6D4S1_HANXR|nr:MAG: hypothetical protein A3F84_01645 [Candidatus Handelsmanbacteria bacterium RIFCSPLOWO2_12_FULL_64_10]